MIECCYEYACVDQLCMIQFRLGSRYQYETNSHDKEINSEEMSREVIGNEECGDEDEYTCT